MTNVFEITAFVTGAFSETQTGLLLHPRGAGRRNESPHPGYQKAKPT
jgi:hypothetical protein